MFERHLRDGMAILDVGVGAGRTVSYLSQRAGSYVALDYSAAMIEACRTRFPGRKFIQADATDLSRFDAASFDAIVFSFNGIDSIPDVTSRTRCLAECFRVLRGGGVFIYSVHNARFLAFPLRLRGASVARRAWRCLYSFIASVRNASRRLPSAAFWRGAGYVIDPLSHGTLPMYVANRDHVRRELERAGFRLLEHVSGRYPDIRGPLSTPWYYYAAVKGDDSDA